MPFSWVSWRNIYRIFVFFKNVLLQMGSSTSFVTTCRLWVTMYVSVNMVSAHSFAMVAILHRSLLRTLMKDSEYNA